MIPRLHHSLFPLLLALGIFAVPTQAQDASPPDWFRKLDRDGSGGISREEMPKLFGQIDTDRDGIGTMAELTVFFTKTQKPTAPNPPVAAAVGPAGSRSNPVGSPIEQGFIGMDAAQTAS